MKRLLFLLALLSYAPSWATVTMTFNSGGFANASGSPTDGMNFAIVVNTSELETTFNPGLYDSFDINSSGQFLTIAGTPTDDYYVWGSIIGLTGFFAPGNLHGFATSLSGIPTDQDLVNPSPIQSGDRFGIIWFVTNSANEGDQYGFLTDPNFIVGSDPSNISYQSFIGNDAKTATYTVVPEPAHFALLLGSLGLGVILLRRRRR